MFVQLETMTDSLIESGADKLKRSKVFNESIIAVLKVAKKKNFRDVDLVKYNCYYDFQL